jgi:hypothetical protein
MIGFEWIKPGWNASHYPSVPIANSTMILSYMHALQRVRVDNNPIRSITFMLKDHVRIKDGECTDLWTEWSTTRAFPELWRIYQLYYPPEATMTDKYYKRFGHLYLIPYYQLHKSTPEYQFQMLIFANPLVAFLENQSRTDETGMDRATIQTWFDTVHDALDKPITDLLALISQTRVDIERMNLTLSFIQERQVGRASYTMDVRELVEDIPYVSPPEFDLWHYFNSLECKESIPYCTYQSFHKFIDVPFIHEIPKRKDWVVSPNELAAYIELDGSYQMVRITPTHVMVASNFVDQDSTPTLLLKSIQTAFGLPELVSKPEHQKKIKAVYHVESPRINLHLFLYFITATDGYNECLFLDESRVLFDQPKRARQYLYLFFYPDPRDKTIFVSFNLSNVSDDMSRQFDEEEKHAEVKTYMRLKVLRCHDQRVMDDMIKFMSNVLSEYTAREAEMAHVFTELNVQLPVIEIPPVKWIKKGHERGLPFIPLEFTPDKLNGRQSEFYLVNSDKVRDEYDYKVGDNPMKFPNGVDKPQAMVYPEKGMDDDSPQKFYLCRLAEHPSYIYSDLKLINERKLPYCFKTNAALNPRTMTLNQPDVRPTARASYVKSTTQLLDVGRSGSVGSWLTRWLNMYHPESVMTRKSIANAPEQSILYALEYITLKRKPTPEDIRRKHLMLSMTLDQHHGELYTYAKTNHIEPFLEQFKSGYIDPMIFGAFLSRHYKIHLFFAKKEGMSRDVFFWIHVKPHSECYSLPVPEYTHFAMIILNKGTEFKNLREPMCEVIELEERLGDKQRLSVFPVTHPLYGTLVKTIDDMYGPKISRGIPQFDERIVSQTINEHGLVSWLHTTSTSYAVMEPLCSLDLPLFYSVHLSGAAGSTNVYKKWKGHYETREGYSYFVPHEEHHTPFKTKLYRWYEVSSRYLQEYTVYAFSRYAIMNGHALTRMNMNSIYMLMVDFAVAVFQFDPSVCDTLFKVSPYLLTSNRYYNYEDNKITIPSDDIRKKLMYRLVHDIKADIEKVEAYSSEPIMRHYYLTPLDFHELPRHHILKETRVFLSYLAHPPHIKHGYVSIQPYAIQPYILFKSFAPFPAQRYLMQPVLSLSQATFLHNEWKLHHINRWRDAGVRSEDTVCHKLVWTSPHSTNIYQDDNLEAPLCSFVNTISGLFVHVMLPL